MDCTPLFKSSKAASLKMRMLEEETINKILVEVADAAIERTDFLVAANKKDLDIMDASDPNYDRLMLTPERISGISSDLRTVAGMTSPLNKILASNKMPNGLEISRVSVPFGVIGIVYEARPNVTFDVFSLCLKSGNACILKGGSDAVNSNLAIVNIIHNILEISGINHLVLTLLPPGRET